MQLRTEILELLRPRIERREDARRHFIPEMPALPRRKTFRRERFDGPHALPPRHSGSGVPNATVSCARRSASTPRRAQRS